MKSGQKIGDPRKLKVRDSAIFSKKHRICGVEGAGTFATQVGSLAAEISREMDATQYMNHVLAMDNNLDSIYQARAKADWLRPSLRSYIRHPGQKDFFKTFFEPLPGIKTNFGFNRDLQNSLESMPKYHDVIKQSVEKVKEHDNICGAQTAIQLRPTSLSGGHAGSPQWLLNLELRMQGFKGLNVGLAAVPSDVASLSIFKKIFPLMLASKRYGYDTWVLWDNNLASSFRTVRKQDEMVLRAIAGTLTAFTWDSTLPGPGDIWRVLEEESNGFVGIAAVEEDIAVRRKVFKKLSDKDVVIDSVRHGISRVVNDLRTCLLEVGPDDSAPQFIVVTGNVNSRDFHSALDQSLLPRSMTAILAPSKQTSVSVARLFPIRGSIRSIDRIFGLKVKKDRRLPDYKLPGSIVQNSIEAVWPVVEQTADFAGVTPEELLEGK